MNKLAFAAIQSVWSYVGRVCRPAACIVWVWPTSLGSESEEVSYRTYLLMFIAIKLIPNACHSSLISLHVTCTHHLSANQQYRQTVTAFSYVTPCSLSGIYQCFRRAWLRIQVLHPWRRRQLMPPKHALVPNHRHLSTRSPRHEAWRPQNSYTRCSLCRLIRAAFFSANVAALSQEVPTAKWMSNQPALWTPDILGPTQYEDT
jgi:hypothetical protein